MTFSPRLLAALTLGATCSAAWSLPDFTVNPAGAGLTGTSITADNMVLSNRSHITIGAGGTFTQSGLLSVQTLQTPIVNSSSGLNETFGLYIAYDATGTGSALTGAMNTAPTNGSYSSFNYTLYGFNGGPATYSFNAANEPVTSASGAIALGSGSLLGGSTGTAPAQNFTSFVPSSNLELTFAVTQEGAGFFSSPTPFYDLAFASFTNTVSQVQVLSSTEYLIQQGGGAFNFAASAVPEPESYAMLMAGLGIVGFLSRRRNVRDVG